jgi:hypothetical protein
MAIETVSCAQNPRRGFGLKWPADNNLPARNPKALPSCRQAQHKTVRSPKRIFQNTMRALLREIQHAPQRFESC